MTTNNQAYFLHTKPAPALLALVALMLVSILLTACAPMALGFSPEEAAVKAVTNTGRSSTQIDPNSIQLLQSAKLDDKVLVLIAYEGIDTKLGGAKSTCMSLYEMHKNPLGMWSPGSGNGSCESRIGGMGEANEPPPQPISVGGGRWGGDAPNAPGTSTVSGKVFDDSIKKVKVTWADETTQEVDVINGSYLIARAGQLGFNKVEALDESDGVVFTNQPEVAPGKK